MAAQPGRTPGWAVFLLGAVAALAVMAMYFVLSEAWRPPSRIFALDVRLPSGPPFPDTPSLPAPPLPIPK
jgi:hypothetical protein